MGRNSKELFPVDFMSGENGCVYGQSTNQSSLSVGNLSLLDCIILIATTSGLMDLFEHTQDDLFVETNGAEVGLLQCYMCSPLTKLCFKIFMNTALMCQTAWELIVSATKMYNLGYLTIINTI